MRLAKLKIFCIFMVSITLLFTLSFAWFDQSYIFPNNVIGKTRGSYFAGGDGTQQNPYIISKANHFFNLSYLQNMGIFNDQPHYFKIADNSGNSITIDFSALNVFPSHKIIQPIGTAEFPFNGVFIGNNSTLKSYIVNGSGKQDVGTFGYVGSTGSITNLFLQSPLIISNPSSQDSTLNYHEHNNGNINVATGYIAGHVANGAILKNIFVISPTISSLSSTFPHRSQLGLIGYNEADGGNVAGGPRDQAYSFTLNALNTYNALKNAVQGFTNSNNVFVEGHGTKTVYGTSVLLRDVIRIPPVSTHGGSYLDIVGLDRYTLPNYTLSTLKISIPGQPDPVYLYDQMVADGNPIGTGDATYKRENIDIVGYLSYKSLDAFTILSTKSFNAPQINSTFNPSNYEQSVILYVKPTNNLNNLGTVTGNYAGGGNLSYNSGWNTSGVYLPGSATRRVAFASSGTQTTMSASNALTAVDVDEETGVMTVVDTTLHTPDLYVFLLSLTNGQSNISNIHFSYVPAVLSIDNLHSISNIDFINNVNDVLDLTDPENDHIFSYVNIGYDLTSTQRIEITTSRLVNNTFEITFDYSITDSSFYNLDIINIKSYTIVVKYGSEVKYSGNHQIIVLRIDPNPNNISWTAKNIGT